jgi:hypothetical protein
MVITPEGRLSTRCCRLCLRKADLRGRRCTAKTGSSDACRKPERQRCFRTIAACRTPAKRTFADFAVAMSWWVAARWAPEPCAEFGCGLN